MKSKLILSSQLFLPENSYSHIHTRDNQSYFSWIDHIVSSSNCHNTISNKTIHYDMTDDDHIPTSFQIQVDRLPSLTKADNNIRGKIKWDCLSEHDIKKYYDLTKHSLSEIYIPVSSILCSDCSCNNDIHTGENYTFFNSIISSLYD